MMQQSRYVCHECHRQWAYAHNWRLGDNCPACGSQSPTLETYTPAFPGADYGDTPSMAMPPDEPAKKAVEEMSLPELQARLASLAKELDPQVNELIGAVL